MKQFRRSLTFAALALVIALIAFSSFGGAIASASVIDSIAQIDDNGDGVPEIWSDAPTNPGINPYDLAIPQSAARTESANIVSDDFNSCQLNAALWTFTDPKDGGASYETDGKRLKITVPEGVDYNLWAGANFAPRVTQPVDNADFQVEAKFESPVTRQYQMQGIIVEDSAGSFLRFGFFASEEPREGLPPKIHVWVFTAVIDATANPPTAFQVVKKEIFPSGNDLYMRVKREFIQDIGFRWIQEYSYDGLTWTPAGTDIGGDFINGLIPAKVGVYAGSTDAGTGLPIPGHTAIVDYFFTTDAPIDPEDAKGYNVTTNSVGQGSVTVNPPGPTYVCGDSLTFTAVPDDGWTFDSWSGDVVGNTNPTTADFIMGMETTATFVESQAMTYTLSLSTGTGNGVALASPNLPFYTEGQQVKLTATPDAGYEFANWSGDVTGTTNPITITMDSNKIVAANFTEIVPEGFTLDVQIFGNGNVIKNPDKAKYMAGEQVTLTATSDAGWAFSGWSGDATGTDASVTVSMDSNKVVLATFTEENYTLAVNTIGDGTVQVTPQQATYKYGDQITLTATPDNGWEFAGWGGALTGLDNPASYTITGDTVINATFSRSDSSVYLPVVRK